MDEVPISIAFNIPLILAHALVPCFFRPFTMARAVSIVVMDCDWIVSMIDGNLLSDVVWKRPEK